MKPEHWNILRDKNHPQILYWFWDEETIHNAQYRKDIKRICEKSTFDLIFLTARGELDFYKDRDVLQNAFLETVQYAHEKGRKIGLQLWRDHSEVTEEDAVSLIVEKEMKLDPSGKAECVSVKTGDRGIEVLSSKLFSAYVMEKTDPGFYRKGSLENVAPRCLQKQIRPGVLEIRADLGEQYAGKTIYFLTAHTYKSPDLFTSYYERSFSKILDCYSGVPFDGIGLDEFKSMNITHTVEIFQKGIKFRQRLYGPGFAHRFEQQTGGSLEQCILEMRYVPEEMPEKRIAAINQYFDVLKENVVLVEKFVAQEARRRYGKDIFVGLHNTYHNSLSNDEIWQTGCMWWDLPREYGQTDEDISYPVRMGISCSYPKPIVYDMFYSHTDADCIYEKAMRDARYGVRIHYHAYHDVRENRFDLADEEFLTKIRGVEDRIQLLNYLDLPRPQMDLLVVFGRPALANWYPHEEFRNDFDINGSLFFEQKCNALWNAGVVCALVPSTKIDQGILCLSNQGEICYNGHRFRQLLFLGPEYSKPKTLQFLLECAKKNPVFVDGEASRDFYGRGCKEKFAEICKYADCHPFDVSYLLAHGVRKNAIPGGAVLEDGTVVLTDCRSALGGEAEPFSLSIDGHLFSGKYQGVLAMKFCDGVLEQFACGGFTCLFCDGIPYLWTDSPGDVAYWRNKGFRLGGEGNRLHFAKEETEDSK